MEQTFKLFEFNIYNDKNTGLSSSDDDSNGNGQHTYNTDKLVTFYYGWCPMNAGGFARKLQIQTQIPLIDRQLNRGFHHITNKETLTYRLENEFIPRARNISKEIQQYVDQHKNISNIL